MGGRAWIALFCLFIAGCSCGAIVIDSSTSDGGDGGDGGDAGVPHTEPRGTGGVPNIFDSGARGSGATVGEPVAADAGEDVILPRSGSVIKVTGIAPDGHPAIVQSVRDDVHSIECSAQLANDGVTRCLPAGTTLAIRYTDANCKNPVAVKDMNNGNSCGLENRQYAVQKFEAICPSRGVVVYSVGDPVAAPAELYSSTVFGCDLEPASSAYEDYFAATPSPAAEWVALEHLVKPVTSRLGVGYWTGSDGSRLIDSAWLLEQDAPCRDEVDGSGNERCIPSRQAHTDSAFFTDDTCKTNVAATFLCDPPDLLVTNVTNEFEQTIARCPQPTTYAKMYTAVHIDSLLVYSTMGGSCVTTRYGGFVYYGPGTEVRFDAFPPIERTHGGAGRLQRRFWASEGRRLYADGLYDSELDSPCRWAPIPKANVCEIEEYSGQYFADPECTVFLYARGASDCAPPKAVAYAMGPHDVCTNDRAVPARRILGKHVGRVYTSSLPGGPCVSSDAPAETVLYDLGEPIEPEQAYARLGSSDF